MANVIRIKRSNVKVKNQQHQSKCWQNSLNNVTETLIHYSLQLHILEIGSNLITYSRFWWISNS